LPESGASGQAQPQPDAIALGAVAVRPPLEQLAPDRGLALVFAARAGQRRADPHRSAPVPRLDRHPQELALCRGEVGHHVEEPPHAEPRHPELGVHRQRLVVRGPGRRPIVLDQRDLRLRRRQSRPVAGPLAPARHRLARQPRQPLLHVRRRHDLERVRELVACQLAAGDQRLEREDDVVDRHAAAREPEAHAHHLRCRRRDPGERLIGLPVPLVLDEGVDGVEHGGHSSG
jgi:hypothetical protein